MANHSRSITELINERQSLAARVAKLNAELQMLDEEIFESAQLYAQAAQALHALGPALGLKPPSKPEPRQPRVIIPIPPPVLLPPPPVGFDDDEDEDGGGTTSAVLRLSPIPGDSPSRRRTTPAGQAIIDGTAKVLREAGKPLKIRDIFDRLTTLGVVITGKVPLNNLSAHLSRSAEFELGPKSEWWFASAEKQEPPEGGS